MWGWEELKGYLDTFDLNCEGHKSDMKLVDHLELINQGKEMDFKVDERGFMRYRTHG
jgi:hypothetical protein